MASKSGWRLSLIAATARTLPRRRLSTAPSGYSSAPSSTARTVLEELEARGLVAQMTSRALRQHVATPRTVYLGVDPTAPSLHMGNLLALSVGGGTGSIGDPSGRSTERNALSSPALNHNVASIRSQILHLTSHGLSYARERTKGRMDLGLNEKGKGRVKVLNNESWLGELGLLEFLRDWGNGLGVKSRLSAPQGISYTEFTYQLLQAYDFSHLNRKHDCTIQLGGSDQYGNIMSGIELMLKVPSEGEANESGVEKGKTEKAEREVEGVYGLTMPLLTTSTGEKFGKSAGNAIWLDGKMTPPVDLYQAFLRTSDADVEKYLRFLTFVPLREIEEVMTRHAAAPEKREPQHLLATEILLLVHGSPALHQAQLATSILFTKSLLKCLPAPSSTILAAFQDSPHLVKLERTEIVGMGWVDALVELGLSKSKGEARTALKSGAISVNHVPVKGVDGKVREEEFLDGKVMVVMKGKGSYKIVDVV